MESLKRVKEETMRFLRKCGLGFESVVSRNCEHLIPFERPEAVVEQQLIAMKEGD